MKKLDLSPVHLALYILLPLTLAVSNSNAQEKDESLVGFWKLQGDCADYSGHENHGINHGVRLEDGTFDGISSFIEVPNRPSLQMGDGDFTINAWIYTDKIVNSVVGDVLSKYDPDIRRGINLSINASRGGYNDFGSARYVYFGIDNAKLSEIQDCGKPGMGSDYISNSIVVYDGHLYAAPAHAKDEADRCHVYRYEGGDQWADMGRVEPVGQSNATGVFAMVVHDGALYVSTSTYDWTRAKDPSYHYDPGRVYRFDSPGKWIDCGEPDKNEIWNGMASYNGHLIIGGGRANYGVYQLKQDAGKEWETLRIFGDLSVPTDVALKSPNPDKCFPHAFTQYHGRLYVAYPFVYSYGDKQWQFDGNAVMSDLSKGALQIHSLTTYQGSLLAGSWPEGRVTKFLGNKQWESIGNVGEDATEVLNLLVYNGKLYAGSLPRAELSRYEGAKKWTSLRRFHEKEGWTPIPPKAPNGANPANRTREVLNEWGRLTSTVVYDGKLYMSTGNNTTSPEDTQFGSENLGKIFSVEAGKNVSYDSDLGAGWKQLTAIRRGGKLELYIDGKQEKISSEFQAGDYNLDHDKPLRIGFGEMDYFSGKISQVRLYKRALSGAEIEKLRSEELVNHEG